VVNTRYYFYFHLDFQNEISKETSTSLTVRIPPFVVGDLALLKSIDSICICSKSSSSSY